MSIGKRLSDFLLNIESERFNDFPDIQMKAKVLRWDINNLLKHTTKSINKDKLVESIQTSQVRTGEKMIIENLKKIGFTDD